MDLFKSYFKDYKMYFFGIIFLVISIFIVFIIIFPEVQSIGSEQKALQQKEDEIKGLQTSLNTINSSNSQNILSSLQTVNAALPSEKDIVSIYNAIITLATKSNINIQDFTLQIGGLYNSGAVKNTGATQAPVGSTPTLSVNITVASNDSRSVFTFSQNLYKVLPLAEIQKINLTGGNGTFAINFFYKPYDANIIAQQTDVKPLTPQEEKILSDLKSWQNQ